VKVHNSVFDIPVTVHLNRFLFK